MTNYDYLRSLPLPELAKYISSCAYCSHFVTGCQGGKWCEEGHIKWLEAEREAPEKSGEMTRQEYLREVLALPAEQAAQALAGSMTGCRFCAKKADNECKRGECAANIREYLEGGRNVRE